MNQSINLVIYGYGKFGKAIEFIAKSSQLNNQMSINYHNVRNGESIAKCNLSSQSKNIIFITTSSKEIPSVITDLEKLDSNYSIVLCAKGLSDCSKNGFHFWSDYVKKNLPDVNLFVLSGPNFTDEIINNIPTYIDLAVFKNSNQCYQEDYNMICDLLYSNQEMVKIIKENQKPSDGYIVQFMAAIKNIIAIEVGYQVGKKTVCNNYISYFAVDIFKKLCYGCFVSLTQQHKIDIDITEQNLNSAILSPAGIGDLILTCFSGKSRNYNFGKNLADENFDFSKFLKENTVEGIEAIKSIIASGYDLSFLDCYSKIKQIL